MNKAVRILFACFIICIGNANSDLKSQNSLKPYTKVVFKEAQKDNKLIVLHFHADWCGICHKQMRIINKLLKNNDKYDKIVALQADFDSSTRSEEEAELVDDLDIDSRSTIIYFKGKRRVYEISNRENVADLVNEVSIKKGLDKLLSKK